MAVDIMHVLYVSGSKAASVIWAQGSSNQSMTKGSIAGLQEM